MGVGAACTRLQPLVTRPALPSLVLKGLGCRLLARCRAMAYAAGVGVRWLFGTLGVVSPDSLLEAPQTLFSELSPQGGLACLLGSEIGAPVRVSSEWRVAVSTVFPAPSFLFVFLRVPTCLYLITSCFQSLHVSLV